MTRSRWSSVLVVLASCASAPAATAPSSAPPAATSIAWRAGPALAPPRDHHASFVATSRVGAALYVVGGTNEAGFLGDAWRAELRADGGLSAWSPATPLPAPRAGAGLVVDGAHVVLVAGKEKRGAESAATVFLATIADDGAIGAWREGPALPEARFHLTASLARGRVFAIGGLRGTKSSAEVWSAPLGADGALGAWALATPLPDTRSHHAACVVGDAVYVLGGLRGDPTDDDHVRDLDDVLRADVGADGALGPWRAAGTLPAAVATHACAVHAGALYVLGGLEGGVVATVRRATIAADGALGPWTTVAPLPRARAHVHQAPVHGAFVYAISGNGGEHRTIADVAIGAFR